MKIKNLILDGVAYILIPLVLWVGFWDKLGVISILLTLAVGTIYTFINKSVNNRYNIFGIMLTSIILLGMFIRLSNKGAYSTFISDMYFYMAIAIFLALTMLLGKNIIKQGFVDLFRLSGYSLNNIYSIIKKYELNNDFYKITSLFIIHFLVVALIKMYALVHYGMDNYMSLRTVEVFSSSLFLVGEFVVMSNFYGKIRRIKKVNSGSVKKVDPRIISFNQYKNFR